jgi:photosystem II stability/assembly factor-like uncharacterized protein
VSNEGHIATSTNSTTFNAVFISISGLYHLYDVAWGGGKFIAVGPDGMILYSTDGTTWTKVTTSTFDNGDYKDAIRSIAWGGGKFIAVGPDGMILYSTDGTTWAEITTSIFHSIPGSYSGSAIHGIAWGGASGQEKFVAVGSVGKIAYWDGATE